MLKMDVGGRRMFYFSLSMLLTQKRTLMTSWFNFFYLKTKCLLNKKIIHWKLFYFEFINASKNKD